MKNAMIVYGYLSSRHHYYYYQVKEKVVLDNLNGSLKAGTITAIMVRPLLPPPLLLLRLFSYFGNFTPRPIYHFCIFPPPPTTTTRALRVQGRPRC